jgi:hypothetical protein
MIDSYCVLTWLDLLYGQIDYLVIETEVPAVPEAAMSGVFLGEHLRDDK